jgi:hypothetical protein
MGYFAPPSQENWRLVDVSSTSRRLRINWIAPGDLATTWGVMATSVIAERSRSDTPDLMEAMSVGLLPAWTDGELVINTRMAVSGNWFFVCTGRGNHAYSDFTAIIRIRIDERLLVGMSCRVRPPCSEQDAQQLLQWMGSAIEEWFEQPVPATSDPSHSAEQEPILAPYLKQLDDAAEIDDHMRAAQIIDVLRPYLVQAPLSRFALNLHATEGWVDKRRAFSQEPAAASRAIETLRSVMDSIDEATHPDLVRVASLWLAQSYSKRDEAGDLLSAILAYRNVIRLAQTADARLASMHFQTGILHRTMGQRLTDSPQEAGAHARLAMEQFDRADKIFTDIGSIAGRIETAIARADSVRFLGPNTGDDEADLYGQAWGLMLGPGGQDALGSERFQSLLNHVFLCMRQLDDKQFGSAPVLEGEGVRALAVFLRPLGLTRKVELRRPAGSTEGEGAVSLEIALARALSPEVALTYVGGAVHPRAASMIATSSDKADWRLAVRLQISNRDLVILIPGYTPGMQWELRFLTEERMLDRTLLIMIPSGIEPEAVGLWQGAQTWARTFGLQLPAYSPEGGFLRLDNDGAVIRRLPFEAVWNHDVLLTSISDLLSEPQEIRQRLQRAQDSLDSAEEAGSAKRMRAGFHSPE